MQKLKNLLVALALSGVSASALALPTVIKVTTTVDEFNGRTVQPAGDSYHLSQGCSLREAIQVINVQTNADYPDCDPPDSSGPLAENVIDLTMAGGTITLNALVPDPNDPTGTNPDVRSGNMPDIFSAATIGKVTITNGAITCDSGNGIGIFHTPGGGDLSLTNLSVSGCIAGRTGVVVWSEGSSNLTLTNVTISAIEGNGGNAGCIDHGDGNLTITDTHFTGCVADDSSAVDPSTSPPINYLPGFGPGNGGALSIGAVGSTTAATLTNVTFQANIAGTNGGAIYLSGTDDIAMTNVTFTLNTANGSTFTSSNAEVGGGAIYATGTATHGRTILEGFPSLFSILNCFFTGNLAPFGTGGAILLSGGQLTYGNLLPGDGTGFPAQIPGGIIASNFVANVASGTWNTNPVGGNSPSNRAGSGGAIYANGVLAVIDSSFVAGNSSAAASGGAIALYGSSTTLDVSNSTFNGNSANVDGGAIANIKDPANNFNGIVTLTNVTIDSNTAAAGGGGGIFNVSTTDADMTVKNSILSNNTGGNCSGHFLDFQVAGVTGNLQFPSPPPPAPPPPNPGCGTMKVGDPELSGTSPAGGPNLQALVMKISNTSAANGNGNQTVCAAAPIYDLDESINTRPSGKPSCDSGAWEGGSLQPVRLQSFEVD